LKTKSLRKTHRKGREGRKGNREIGKTQAAEFLNYQLTQLPNYQILFASFASFAVKDLTGVLNAEQ
jgi:hypothetical protein